MTELNSEFTRRLTTIALAITSVLVITEPKPARAIASGVSFHEAMAYAESGLNEPYTSGGMWWYDNDSWLGDANADGKPDKKADAASTYEKGRDSTLREGPDCSGYVMKVWAVAIYSEPNEAVTRQYDSNDPGTQPDEWYYTFTWYDNETHKDGNNRDEWYKQTFDGLGYLDVLVWKYPNAQPAPGHIVFYMGKTDKGRIITWEASGSKVGTRQYTGRTTAFYKDKNKVRYRKRATWEVTCRQCVE